MKKETKHSLLGSLILLLVIAAKLVVDISIWRSGKPIRHTKEWLLFAPFYAIAVWFLTKGLLTANHFKLLSIPGIAYLILSSITAMGTVWFLFDGFFQLVRAWISKTPKEFPFFGLGSVDGNDDAESDRWLQRFSKKTQVVFKFIFLIIPLFVYLLIFL